jgi:DNA-nicking Smr family endonuclease
VVTGRSGLIRREFPQWLDTEAFRRLVRTASPCPPGRGGDGAFQVSLRV